MFPRFPATNKLNSAVANIIFSAKRPKSTVGAFFYNTHNNIIGKFRKMGPLPFWSVPSAFFEHIIRVICVGAYKQMRWIDAMTNIAFMTDNLTIGDLSKMNHPRNPMSKVYAIFVKAKMAILGTFKYGSDPKPAGFGFFNFLKKSVMHFRIPEDLLHGSLHSEAYVTHMTQYVEL